MARPRTAPETKKIHPVTFWLSTPDYAPLVQAAGIERVGVNELARRITCAGKKRLIIRTCSRVDPALLLALQRIGTNLNQLTKLAHMRGGRISPKVEELCNEIQNVIREAIKDQEAA